jgi:SAM-dependent methyltransferase
LETWLVAAEDGSFCSKADKIYLTPGAMFRKIIQSYCTHASVRHTDPDSPENLLRHAEIIREKSQLREIYIQWYGSIRSWLSLAGTGPVLELGSGGGFLKEFFPDLIASEIIYHPGVDAVLDGQQLPFRKTTLNGIVMVDVFHHIPDVKRLFSEAARCIKSRGVMVMVEPWTTPWSRLVYRYLHQEPFNPLTKHWRFNDCGRMSGANSALPWIVFDRDRNIFEQDFPEWSIQDLVLHTPFTYLLSGGISFRNVLPDPLFRAFRRMEDKLELWMPYCAMFATIALRRK